MNYQLIGDRIAVLPAPVEAVTPGGIHKAEIAIEKPQSGDVVAVGDGIRLDNGKLVPLRLRVGDKVKYGKFAGISTTLNDKEVLIMSEADILMFSREE